MPLTAAHLLEDAFGRIEESLDAVLGDLDVDDLARPPAPGTNSIAWLVWHLARVVDDHLAAVAERPQVWEAEGFRARLALDLPADDTGYGHGPDEVARVRASGADLAGYARAALALAVEVVHGLDDADLERVVDEAWDPPVTLAVRLVSVLDDATRHIGQAEYVRGLLDRR
ncbi:DinB family protein [Nocardioides sp. TRM66260-LWL]|uniref:mycothiol transferase n=1 Tax=Nocardioides sp. TRM66260-LWL TaxID=2874478 RepID=UPI001CC441F1|nr:DUF664 domain-containing protein [Nocardioides sp. TRM66260-LWL]MBZ5735616.1 DinB family protein [Nocardioides sp. TRM66260-LWL]